jgi:hypothetical protein
MLRLIALLMLTLPVHSWYPDDCCGDMHCHPTRCEDITSDGVFWHWRGLEFSGGMVKSTRDADCHVCHDMEGGKPVGPRCLFVRNSV